MEKIEICKKCGCVKYYSESEDKYLCSNCDRELLLRIANTKKVEIKYFDDELPKVEKINKGDWIDLRAAQDVSIAKGEFALIPLGIAMKLPDGYEAHVVPRSSTFKTWGIIQTNSMGIIDNTYCGDNDQWMFPAFALRDSEINKGDRICQFRIVENQPNIQFDFVDRLEGEDRGGFGSTGR